MLNVVYIPGLGDTKITGQRLAVRTWRVWGVQPHVFHMKWHDTEPFDQKFKRLLNLIDDLRKTGEVALVGASAGATAVINAYAARPDDVKAVVFIAGKVNNPGAIGEAYKRRAPSFWTSAQQTTESLGKLNDEQRSRMLSIRAMVDMIVPSRDSIVEGAHNKVAWTSGHALTIGWQIVFGAPKFIRFVKRQNSSNKV